MTQTEIESVLEEAKKQGIDLTQIAIFYGRPDSAASQLGSFSPDGIPLASNGDPLSLDQITGFYYLAAD